MILGIIYILVYKHNPVDRVLGILGNKSKTFITILTIIASIYVLEMVYHVYPTRELYYAKESTVANRINGRGA